MIQRCTGLGGGRGSWLFRRNTEVLHNPLTQQIFLI
jgi:hypothetical protein